MKLGVHQAEGRQGLETSGTIQMAGGGVWRQSQGLPGLVGKLGRREGLPVVLGLSLGSGDPECVSWLLEFAESF